MNDDPMLYCASGATAHKTFRWSFQANNVRVAGLGGEAGAGSEPPSPLRPPPAPRHETQADMDVVAPSPQQPPWAPRHEGAFASPTEPLSVHTGMPSFQHTGAHCRSATAQKALAFLKIIESNATT